MIKRFIERKLRKSRITSLRRKIFNKGREVGVTEMREEIDELKKGIRRKEQKINQEKLDITNSMHELNMTITEYEKLIVDLKSIKTQKGIINEEILHKRVQLIALDSDVSSIQKKRKRILAARNVVDERNG